MVASGMSSNSRRALTAGAMADKDAAYFEKAAQILSVLSNARRFAILNDLLANELTVGDIGSRHGLSQSAASQHLALMRDAGIVQTRRDAQTIHYSVVDERVRNLLASIRRTLT